MPMVPELPPISETGRYSISAAAKLLGISRPSLYKLIQKGWIIPRKYRNSNRPYVCGADIRRCYYKIVN